MSCSRCGADGSHRWLLRLRDEGHRARTSATLCDDCRDEFGRWLRGGGA